MFNLFKSDPAAKLEKQLRKKMEQAAEAQRAGKIPLYAVLSAEAEEMQQQLDRLRESSG